MKERPSNDEAPLDHRGPMSASLSTGMAHIILCAEDEPSEL